MPRPRFGKKIRRGLALWVEILRSWWQVGFIPDWDAKQQNDAEHALKYLIKLLSWFETKGDEKEGVQADPLAKVDGVKLEGETSTPTPV